MPMLRLLQHQHRPRGSLSARQSRNTRPPAARYSDGPESWGVPARWFRNDGSEGDDLAGWVLEVPVEALEHVAELFVEEGLADGGLAVMVGGCFVPWYGEEVDLFVLRCGEEG
ncbi:uncharacterized protein TrAtP1_004981 [Trichoderma atroviride]|uniref:uncharacterized protein n=1 Tax=Hypocrea atroviridis TaxID=63577 RepID=UPI00332A06E3|nr:hypothetical protein TrAtP1_004981 [Trichoderma atroviride]